MTIATVYTEAEAREIASTIKRQIGAGSLMALAAHDFIALDGGLRFIARILPFNKNGKRSTRAAKMLVEVKLNFMDLYDVRVVEVRNFELVEHFTVQHVDAYSLPRLMLALDFDGDEVLNPRYM